MTETSKKPVRKAGTKQVAAPETSTVTELSLDMIDIGERLRPVDPDRAAMMALSIEQSGLMYPVDVRPSPVHEGRYVLISGGHRLAAFRELERATIPAVVHVIGDIEAKRREIQENIYRADLTELDRSVFFDAQKRLYEAEHPETKHGGDRVSEQAAIFGDKVLRFTLEAQEKLGCSERTVQRILARAAIPADIRSRIAFTGLANKGAELDALIKLTEEDQHKVLDIVLSEDDGAPKTVSAASRLIRDTRVAPEKDPADAAFDKFLGVWKNAPEKARDLIVAHLVAKGYCAPISNEMKDVA